MAESWVVCRMNFEEIVRLKIPGRDRGNLGLELVTVGVPFPIGLLENERQILLVDERENQISASFIPTCRWSDKSIKWGVLEFFVDMAEATSMEVKICMLAESRGAAKDEKAIIRGMDEIVIERNGLLFAIDTRHFRPFKGIRFIDGKEICTGSSTELEFVNARRADFEIGEVNVRNTDFKSVVSFSGNASGGSIRNAAKFDSTVTIYDELIKIEFTIRNPKAARHYGGLWDLGDKNSLFIKDLSLRFRIASLAGGSYSTGLGDHEARTFTIYQGSSGGGNSYHVNHVDRDGKVHIRCDGFVVHSENGVVEKGARSDAMVVAKGDSFFVAAAMPRFWQNFPKTMELKDDSIRLGIFPKENEFGHELQPGEQKTHTVFMRISKGDPRIVWVHDPLVAEVPPSWYRKTHAIPYLDNQETSLHPVFEDIIGSLAHGKNTIADRREAIDEYGWRNYGDVFADHEYHESATKPDIRSFVSHYNNQYDILASMFCQYFQTSDPQWFFFALDLARHIQDIDTYHTDHDKSNFNHGLFWHTDHFVTACTATHRTFSILTKKQKGVQAYGGGPGYDHNYTRGLKYYYFLTGDEIARKTILGMADWTIRGIEGIGTFAETLERTIRSRWGRRRRRNILTPYSFEGPGRSSGNALQVCLDAFELTNDHTYLRTAEQLIRKCVSPEDDIEERNLLEPNIRWMYTIFFMGLESYLHVKRQIYELDAMYSYGVVSLANYARWMSANEQSFLDRVGELDFPNFATRAAQDLRKCAVMLSAMKYCRDEDKDALYQRTLAIYRKSVEYLSGTENRHLIRPAAVVMAVEGVLRAGFGPKHAVPVPESDPDTLPISGKSGPFRLFLKMFYYTSVMKEYRIVKMRMRELLHNRKIYLV